MKKKMRWHVLFLCFGLLITACAPQKEQPEATKSVTIQLDELSETHPNKKQMLYFLNNYKEPFVRLEMDQQIADQDKLIEQQFYFQTKNSKVDLFLLFFEHQQDAITLAQHNAFPENELQDWSVNGAVLFLVQGKDKWEVADVLSWFAGEE
ncbi:MAG: hypothetical protein ACPGWR_06865 [Ardenticatenaceae bacterium]